MDLGQGEQLGFELLLGNIGSHDLVFNFSVLEKEQKRNRANTVFHREFTGVIDVDFAHLCLTSDVVGQLIDDGTDRLAGTAPFGPEIDKDGNGRLENFRLEIGFIECLCHADMMNCDGPYVKNQQRKKRCFHIA